MAPERITYTAPQQFPESIDWDAKHECFLVGILSTTAAAPWESRLTHHGIAWLSPSSPTPRRPTTARLQDTILTDGSSPAVFAASPLFESFPTVFEMFPLGLNGMVVHENGYIITFNLRQGVGFKVPLDGSEPTHIAINGVFPGADGIRLRPDGRLVITTNDDVYLVESDNDWRSARIVEKVPQDPTISTTAVAIRDKRAYINYAWFAEAFGGKQRSEFYMQVVDIKFDAA